MVNQQLLDYVRGQLSAGTAKDTISQALVAIGWTAQDAQEAFAMLEARSSLPASPLPPSLAVAPLMNRSEMAQNGRPTHHLRTILIVLTVLLVGAGVAAGGYYLYTLYTTVSLPSAVVVPPPTPFATTTASFSSTSTPVSMPISIATTTIASTTLSISTTTKPKMTIAVQIGFILESQPGSPNFKDIILPWIVSSVSGKQNPGPFSVYIWKDNAFVLYQSAPALTTIHLPPGGVSKVKVLGIDPTLKISPTSQDYTVGIGFIESGTFAGTKTVITQDVPE